MIMIMSGTLNSSNSTQRLWSWWWWWSGLRLVVPWWSKLVRVQQRVEVPQVQRQRAEWCWSWCSRGCLAGKRRSTTDLVRRTSRHSSARPGSRTSTAPLLCLLTPPVKPGFHYPSWRPELTARVDGWPVSITRQHGPCWRACVSTSRNLGRLLG